MYVALKADIDSVRKDALKDVGEVQSVVSKLNENFDKRLEKYEEQSKKAFADTIGQMKDDLMNALKQDSEDDDSDVEDSEEDEEEGQRLMSQRSLRKRHTSFTLSFDPETATQNELDKGLERASNAGSTSSVQNLLEAHNADPNLLILTTNELGGSFREGIKRKSFVSFKMVDEMSGEADGRGAVYHSILFRAIEDQYHDIVEILLRGGTRSNYWAGAGTSWKYCCCLSSQRTQTGRLKKGYPDGVRYDSAYGGN